MQNELNTAQKVVTVALDFAVRYSFEIVGALIVLLGGLLAANWTAAFLFRFLQKKRLDVTLSKFLAALVRVLILSFAAVIALGKFGITIAPFVAALGALTFGASMAVQGPLSNYGAGLSIIFSRPFVVGDTITVADVSGVVQEVKLACTVLTNEDGTRITIPNKDIVGQILHNSMKNKVVEGLVGISYQADPEKAIRAVEGVLARFADVSQAPGPQVGIAGFGDSAVNLAFRYWVPTAKYFQLSYAVNLAVYKALQAEGISIPYPQREVRVLSAERSF